MLEAKVFVSRNSLKNVPRRTAKRFTKSEYEILRAMVTSLSYAEVARKTGFTIPYISRKVRDLHSRVYLSAWFDFRAMGLVQVFVEARYDEEVVKALAEVQPPYILSASHLFRGKRDSLLLYSLLPEPYVDKVVEALPLYDKEVMIPLAYYRWRPDEALLTRFEEGQVVGDVERIPEAYASVQAEEKASAVRTLPDEIDLAIFSKLLQDPYANLIDVARALGVRQQVVSYHFLRHVKPLWLYNAVVLDFNPEEVPLKIYQVYTSGVDSAKTLAKALVQTPYFQAAFVISGDSRRVIAMATLPTHLELKTMRALRSIDSVEDFEILAVMECDVILRWALPSVGLVAEGTWIVEPLLQKLDELSSRIALR